MGRKKASTPRRRPDSRLVVPPSVVDDGGSSSSDDSFPSRRPERKKRKRGLARLRREVSPMGGGARSISSRPPEVQGSSQSPPSFRLVLKSFPLERAKSSDAVLPGMKLVENEQDGSLSLVREKWSGQRLQDEDGDESEGEKEANVRLATSDSSRSLLVELVRDSYVLDLELLGLEKDNLLDVAQLYKQNIVELFISQASESALDLILLPRAFTIVKLHDIPPITRPAVRLLRKVVGLLFPADLLPWSPNPPEIAKGAPLASRVYSAFESRRKSDPVLQQKLREGSKGVGSGAADAGLIPALRPYQQAAVDWMVQREDGKGSMLSPISVARSLGWVELPLAGMYQDRNAFVAFNALTGAFATSVPDIPATSPRGGILADEMGLGKTIEILGLILSHPYETDMKSGIKLAEGDTAPKSPTPHERSNDTNPPATPTAIPNSNYWNDLTPRDPQYAELGQGCICGECVNLEGETATVVCSTCNWRLHARCAQLSLGQTLALKSEELENASEHICVACAITKQNPGLKAKTTLVVCPTPLLQQWKLEIGRHVLPGALSLAVYPGVREIQRNGPRGPGLGLALLRPSVLAEHDIILTTFDVMRTELHHATQPPGVSSSARSPGGKSMRYRKRYRVVPSPLTSIEWWRVVLDEAQMVETSTADAARMALQLPSLHRWCVSGTPLGRGQLDDLYGLMVFLRAYPFDIRSVWTHAFLRLVDSFDPCAMERLMTAMAPIWWRTTKSSVRDQLNLPPQSEVERLLCFTSVERHFYQKQHADIQSRALKLLKRTRRSGDESAALSSLALPLLKLRQACCHPQVGANGVRGHGGSVQGVMSMNEILDTLIDDARTSGLEAQRGVIMTLHGMAAIARMRAETFDESATSHAALLAEAAGHYQRVFDLSKENRVPLPVTGNATITGSSSLEGQAEPRSHPAGEVIPFVFSPNVTSDSWAKLEFAQRKRLVQFRVRASRCSCLSLEVGRHAEGAGFDPLCTVQLSEKDSWSKWYTISDTTISRSRTWRVVWEDTSPESDKEKDEVKVEVEFKEAMLDADPLQLLHASHNLALVQRSRLASCASLSAQLNVADVETLAQEVRNTYLSAYRTDHDLAMARLSGATLNFDESLKSGRRGGAAWWDLALLRLEQDMQQERSLRSLVQEAMGQLTDGSYDGILPTFDTMAGIRAWASMELDRLQVTRKGVLKKIMALSPVPTVSEVAENSSCGVCRKDWGATGETCRHCSLLEEIENWGKFLSVVKMHGEGAARAPVRVEAPLIKLFRLILQWCKRGGGESWGQVTKLGSLELGPNGYWDCLQREYALARNMHRVHANLLSGIDELQSATQTIRLALPDEDVSHLTEDQRKLVAFPHELDEMRSELVAQKADYELSLSEARNQMTFLGNVWQDNHSQATMRICAVCLDSLGDEIAVAGCGHSFHSECCLLLLGTRDVFICPTCRKKTPRSSVSVASNLSTTDGSQACVRVTGSWGTKVQSLVADIISLSDEKSLVFSEWEEMLAIVESALKANNVPCARIQHNKDFAVLLPKFREGEGGTRVLLLPLRKGAEGLNLVEATHVFLLEPVLNAAAEAQAINRVHRIGQTKPTMVHRMIVADTIEVGIRSLQARRAEEAGGEDALLLTDAAASRRASGYTRDDIETLFTSKNVTGRMVVNGEEARA